MPVICYQDKTFSADHEGVIRQANAIIREYQAEGYTITLRQLYYQFVARDLIPNNMQSYKRLGSIVNDARLAGRIDWNAIEDRTRNLEKQSTWDSTKDILETCAEQFRYDWWLHQPVRIEIWPEKEALVGVIERIAFKYRLPYFACRGYTSQSEAWRAGRRFLEYNEAGQDVVVLHLGDHDPSGIDMTRDNDARLQMFSQNIESGLDELPRVEIKRMALNMDQVRKYKPPPNPAKLTDSRATDYIAKFGRNSWELDALDPKVIDEILSNEIEKYIDSDLWAESVAAEKKARSRLRKMAAEWSDE